MTKPHLPHVDHAAHADHPGTQSLTATYTREGMISAGIAATRDIVLAALKDQTQNPWARSCIVIIGLMTIVNLIGCGFLGFAQQYGYAFALAIVLIILVFGLLFYAAKRVADIAETNIQTVTVGHRNPGSPANAVAIPEAPEPEADSVQIFPKTPLKPTVTDNLRERLATIQGEAFIFLKEKIPTLERGNIRANIFLPVTDTLFSGGTLELGIPDQLHVAMEDGPGKHSGEIGIRFKPNQGAVGVVFASKRIEVACATPGKKISQWEDRYSLTDAQKTSIHPQLMWVISYPLISDKLKSENCSGAMGVLNVDCVEIFIDKTLLIVLVGSLLGKIAPIVALLAEQRMSTLSVTLK